MDILESIVFVMRCPSCGQTYALSGAQIFGSQELLNEECFARGESECPPLYRATLLNHDDLAELRETWQKLEQQARNHGATLQVA